MAEEPVTVSTLQRTLTTAFATFHRDVLVPEVERTVGESEARIHRGFDDVNAHFDQVYERLDRLETEYEMVEVASLQAKLEELEAQL